MKMTTKNKINTILYDVVNAEENERFLSKVPHIDYQDISIFFYFEDTRTILSKQFLETSPFSLNDIFKIAKTNMENKYPTKPKIKFSSTSKPLFYKFSNDSKCGITSFFTDKTNEMLKTISDKMYVFFVSNREAVALDLNTFSMEEAKALSDINAQLFKQMEEYTVSSRLYLYNTKSRELMNVKHLKPKAELKEIYENNANVEENIEEFEENLEF